MNLEKYLKNPKNIQKKIIENLNKKLIFIIIKLLLYLN